LFGTAAFYDLESKAERAQSVAHLEHFFFRACRETKPDLFVEAGAKDATSSRRARRYLPDARIVAFEANPLNYERFSTRENGRLNVEYVHCALTGSDGDVTFIMRADDGSPRSDGQGSLLTRTDGSQGRPVTVKAARLDTHFPSNTFNSCAIWIDVEGATRDVLAGATGIMPNVSLMFIEVEDRQYWAGQWLSGDVLKFCHSHGLVPIARDFQSRYQYNLLLVRRSMLRHPQFRNVWANYHSEIGLWARRPR